ncbi:hypothetical protein FA13DRAFT_1716757 [Coprinellus micaceus]|uniref:Uncharacterized protein n=1 Tax=Coprinellus micaceus TaxID=71717 RepID=A0A4Y7SI80_COPMI|nr:hypothetical protein FA13DRAFT_1716757 [Coprinellus micaceus]
MAARSKRGDVFPSGLYSEVCWWRITTSAMAGVESGRDVRGEPRDDGDEGRLERRGWAWLRFRCVVQDPRAGDNDGDFVVVGMKPSRSFGEPYTGARLLKMGYDDNSAPNGLYHGMRAVELVPLPRGSCRYNAYTNWWRAIWHECCEYDGENQDFPYLVRTELAGGLTEVGRYEWMDPFSCIDRARISLAALPTFDHQAHITHDLPRSPQSPSRHLAAHGTIRDDPPSLGSHTPPVIAVVLASSSLPFPPDERVHLLEVSIYETQHELASARALLCVFERETWQTRGARRPFHLPQRRRAVESTYRHRIFRTCPFNAIERLGRVRETWSHPVWCSVGTYGGGRLRLKGC